MDSTAINEIISHAAAGRIVDDTATRHSDVAVVPPNWKLVSMESFNDTPDRHRLRIYTDSVETFMAVVGSADLEHMKDATIYIRSDATAAECIFDHGRPGSPAWKEHRCQFAPKITPEFHALNTTIAPLSQHELIDFLSDWPECYTGIDNQGGSISHVELIRLLRRIDIKASVTATSVAENYKSERSVMDAVTASSADQSLPALVVFTGRIFEDTAPQQIDCRLYILPGDGKNPKLRLRPIGVEKARRTVADEIKDRIVEYISGDIPIYIGEAK
jgi:uncharacterized protein YfdQ (DUF2303 family)